MRDDPETLTPKQFWRNIARQGGWIGRKSDGRPGWKTIWRGWYDVHQEEKVRAHSQTTVVQKDGGWRRGPFPRKAAHGSSQYGELEDGFGNHQAAEGEHGDEADAAGEAKEEDGAGQ